MSVEVIDKIKPKNNADFPLVDAADIEMPDGTRLSDHDFLESSELPEAVNVALTQAKESGAFDGKTPVKGEDYWTATDKQEIVDDVLEQIEIPEGSGGSAEVPVFDLASRGVPAVTLPQGASQVAGDMSDIVTALSKGSAIFKIPVSLNGMTISISLTMQAFTDGSGGYQCVSMVLQDVMLMAVVSVTSSVVQVLVAPAVTFLGLPFVTGADNGKFMQVVNGSWAAVALQDVSEVGA